MTSMKEGTSAQLSGRGELHGGARVTTLVTLRKCTLGYKREIKTLKFVSASTKGFKGGLAWIKPSKKDMAVTFSYFRAFLFGAILVHARHRETTSVLNGSPKPVLDRESGYCCICGIWLLFRVEGGFYFYIFGFWTLDFEKCKH